MWVSKLQRPQSERLFVTSLPETHIMLAPESQMAQPILMSCDLPRGERFRAFKSEFAEWSFSMKEVIVPGSTPQPGAEGSQPTCTAASQWHQHAPQGPAHITTPLLRAHPALGKLGSEAKARTPQLDSGSSFWPPETGASTFSSLLIRSAENCRAWLAWDTVLHVSAKSNYAFVYPKSHAKRWKFFSNAKVVSGLLLQIISH